MLWSRLIVQGELELPEELGSEKVSVRLYMPSEDFKRRFKAACDRQGRSMSEVASELIEVWLAENEFMPPSQLEQDD